jgi:hypothetical protein
MPSKLQVLRFKTGFPVLLSDITEEHCQHTLLIYSGYVVSQI